MEIPTSFREVMENKQLQDLNPIMLGRDLCAPNFHFNPTVREYYLIHYVISGKGVFCINGSSYTVTANQIFIIPIHTENFYQADAEDPWDYIWVAFTGNLSHYFSQLPPVMHFPSNLFFEMLEVRNFNTMREEFLAEKLFALYRFLFSKHTSTNYSAAVKTFIKANYMDPTLSVEQLAKSLNLNRDYLLRRFKQDYNCSIQEYLIRTRINQAISFLDMEYNIQQIAGLVGYSDVSNFSKIFKKYVGVSPQTYQKQKSDMKSNV